MNLAFLFNHCQTCGARIPWRMKAYFGNSYKPVICRPCNRTLVSRAYGSYESYEDAMLIAEIQEEARL